MNSPRIAIIGAGSLKFTAQILASLLAREATRYAHVTLMDIDPARLALVDRYARAIAAHAGDTLAIHSTESRGDALVDADFVLVTVAIGGLALKQMDVEICREHGVIQVKGDTTGPAGIIRGLRSIPFMLDLARDMEQVCPDALMINLSNPLSTLTGAVTQHTSIRAIGICTSVEGMRHDFADKLGVSQDRVRLMSAGVNHFTWLTDLYLDGKRRMDLLQDVIAPAFEGLPVTLDLYRAYGMFPIPGYKYASEFFPFFTSCAGESGKPLGFSPFDAASEAESLNASLAGIEDVLAGRTPFSMPPVNTDSEAVVSLIESMVSGTPGIHTINCRNEGQVPWLPEDATVECQAYVCGWQIAPLCTGAFTAGVQQLLLRVTQAHRLVIEAALTGDRAKALEALLMDALTPSIDTARTLLDTLLERQRPYLPAFWPTGGDET